MRTTSRRSPNWSRARGLSRSSGRVGSGRRQWRSQPAAASARRRTSLPGGVWLARLETAVTDDDVVDSLVAALNVGGEAALVERLKGGGDTLVILDNCEHVIDAAAALTVRLLDAAPGLRILCTSQVPLGIDGEVVFELAPLELSDAVALFKGRASAQRTSRTTSASDDAVRGSVPIARWSPARDRTRRGTNEDVVDPGDHSPPRQSVQRVERSDQPRTGTSSSAEVNDPLELRAVVPRRPAWAVGSGRVRRRCTPPGGRGRPRSARGTGRRSNRRHRPAREPFAGDRRRRWCDRWQSATGCSTASARSRSKR